MFLEESVKSLHGLLVWWHHFCGTLIKNTLTESYKEIQDKPKLEEIPQNKQLAFFKNVKVMKDEVWLRNCVKWKETSGLSHPGPGKKCFFFLLY